MKHTGPEKPSAKKRKKEQHTPVYIYISHRTLRISEIKLTERASASHMQRRETDIRFFNSNTDAKRQ